MTKKCDCQPGSSCGCAKRCSSRRRAVLAALAGTRGHFNAAELHRRALRRSPGIGIATVYRSLKCLCGCGKAIEVKLADGGAVYEAASPRPHAHLVCSSCGSVAEAAAPELEELVAALAARNSFSPAALELRGLCANCSTKGKMK
ncbi:MAG: transcriptional repressor [Elusimicrobiales bacterium]|nr:transcriptional repressor [Elusimicrobiales bacterium]